MLHCALIVSDWFELLGKPFTGLICHTNVPWLVGVTGESFLNSVLHTNSPWVVRVAGQVSPMPHVAHLVSLAVFNSLVWSFPGAARHMDAHPSLCILMDGCVFF